MDYQETTKYLFTSTPVFEHVGASAYKEGLGNTLALDEHFGHPHLRYRTIHVAGTNGKGSCSHTLAAILQAQGYKVGLYTSPHLVDFRERIRVNGKCVSEEYVIDFVEKERVFFEPLHPSFFELTTAMAFKYFAEQKVDIAVVEVGLGGRLDCTNIINPLISVITNISLDHTKFLGNTLRQIAREKAGIIKESIPVVIGETVAETREVFLSKAEAMHAPIHFAEEEYATLTSRSLPEGGRLYHIYNKEFRAELGGDYQERNMRTILSSIDLLRQRGIDCSERSFLEGVNHVCELTGLMGRWQTLRQKPRVICDTGHNVGAWTYLASQLKTQSCQRLRVIFGMVDDKDVDTVMDMLPKDAAYYWTQASSHRAIPVEAIAKKGEQRRLRGKIHKNVSEAYQAALSDCNEDDLIFVGGSSYIVADLLSIKVF